jgi:hypothetical protein
MESVVVHSCRSARRTRAFLPFLGPRMNEEVHDRGHAANSVGTSWSNDEVAQAVLYLYSPGAEHTTGALLPMDGGTSAAAGNLVARLARRAAWETSATHSTTLGSQPRYESPTTD